MLMGQAVEYKRLRAPAEDGGRLVAPPLARVAEVVERNAAITSAADYDVQGRPLVQLAEQARREVVEAAWRYTSAYRDVERPAVERGTRLVLAGHQPQLFHPGVWFKNFVLGAIGRRTGGVAINLAIDSDTIKTASLRIPTGTVARPLVDNVPFDEPTAEIPYEERAIVDRDCLASFAERAAAAIGPFVAEPFVREFWPRVVDRAAHGANLGECIAQARHQHEASWDNQTLEIPQSQVCELPSFHWFACHLFARLPLVWEQYNQSVADFRRANHVRSSAHPVPDLAVQDDWLEAPFWIWDRDDPRRRRLWVRQHGDEIVLADRQSFEYALALSPEGEADRAAGQLAELSARGIRLRTRALITTLFARVVLGDLFLHGIGGAKYDQVTDSLVERFFGIKPPEYMTVTATLRLPIDRPQATPDDARQASAALRDMVYHPERHLAVDGNPAIESLVREKRRWIETSPTRDNARERCRRIRAANEQLQPYLADARQQTVRHRDDVESALRSQAILASRDYAFCLYPSEPLERLMDLSRLE